MHWPDDWQTAQERRYSPLVAYLLRRGYEAAGRLDFALSAAFAVDCARETMGRRQRMRVYYLRALGLAHDHRFADAIPLAFEALDIALAVKERVARPDLYYLLANCHAGVRQYQRSAQFSIQALDALVRGGVSTARTRRMQLDILFDLIVATFTLGDFETCERHLGRAEQVVLAPSPSAPDPASLAPRVPAFTLDRALLEWHWALLYRWRRRPDESLARTRLAAHVVMQQGTEASKGRILTVMADSSLDIAEAFSPDWMYAGRSEYLTMARKYAADAARLCLAAGDWLGEAQARLALARHGWLSGNGYDRQAAIAHALMVGRAEGDPALIAQARTAEGDELRRKGLLDQARNVYVVALEVLSISEMGAARIGALRALRETDRALAEGL